MLAQADPPTLTAASPTIAERAVRAAADPTSWEAIADAYLEAEQASNEATAREADAVGDGVHNANQPIHAAWKRARSRLLDHPSPHWGALALKATLFQRMWDSSGCCDTRYARAARRLAEAADVIDECDPCTADPIDVLTARGSAEQLCYYLAHDGDGYKDWAIGGHVAQIAAEAEGILAESRNLARLNPRALGLSAAVIDAVWLGQLPTGVEDEASDRPPTWDDLLARYEAAQAAATRLSDDQEALPTTISPSGHDAFEKQVEAAWVAVDEAHAELINYPVTDAGSLARKIQLGADRWVFQSRDDTLSDPAFVQRSIDGREAEPWLWARLYEDALRLAGTDAVK